MRKLVARVVWSAWIAALCVIAAVVVAIVYGEAERVVVFALVGGGLTFAILAPRT
jgi:hypothetical protein